MKELNYLIQELLHLAGMLNEIREFEFHPPASETEIQELEQHLQVSLPEDYKNFLRFSNGARLNHFTAELYSVAEIISFSDMKKADWFPAEYVMLADIIGDGEVLCFSKKTKKIVRYFDGEEKEFETFTDFLEDMIDFIKRTAELE